MSPRKKPEDDDDGSGEPDPNAMIITITKRTKDASRDSMQTFVQTCERDRNVAKHYSLQRKVSALPEADLAREIMAGVPSFTKFRVLPNSENEPNEQIMANFLQDTDHHNESDNFQSQTFQTIEDIIVSKEKKREEPFEPTSASGPSPTGRPMIFPRPSPPKIPHPKTVQEQAEEAAIGTNRERYGPIEKAMSQPNLRRPVQININPNRPPGVGSPPESPGRKFPISPRGQFPKRSKTVDVSETSHGDDPAIKVCSAPVSPRGASRRASQLYDMSLKTTGKSDRPRPSAMNFGRTPTPTRQKQSIIDEDIGSGYDPSNSAYDDDFFSVYSPPAATSPQPDSLLEQGFGLPAVDERVSDAFGEAQDYEYDDDIGSGYDPYSSSYAYDDKQKDLEYNPYGDDENPYAEQPPNQPHQSHHHQYDHQEQQYPIESETGVGGGYEGDPDPYQKHGHQHHGGDDEFIVGQLECIGIDGEHQHHDRQETPFSTFELRNIRINNNLIEIQNEIERVLREDIERTIDSDLLEECLDAISTQQETDIKNNEQQEKLHRELVITQTQTSPRSFQNAPPPSLVGQATAIAITKPSFPVPRTGSAKSPPRFFQQPIPSKPGPRTNPAFREGGSKFKLGDAPVMQLQPKQIEQPRPISNYFSEPYFDEHSMEEPVGSPRQDQQLHISPRAKGTNKQYRESVVASSTVHYFTTPRCNCCSEPIPLGARFLKWEGLDYIQGHFCCSSCQIVFTPTHKVIADPSNTNLQPLCENCYLQPR